MIDLKSTSGALRPHDPTGQGWTGRDATHLLWRTGYGATPTEIEQAADEGYEKTLERLLSPQEESAEFQSAEPLLRRIAIDTGDIDHLKAWWLYRMLNTANPLVEKMSLFWHNHFATSNVKVQSVRHMAAQNDLIRRAAMGSFRGLLSGMARDVAMLTWLDSNANRKRRANENFAREVMELFSLGVGNYTEHDIAEAARAFTGWHVRHEEFWFSKRQHDFEKKTVLGKTGNFDGQEVIEICLAQPACPRFLAGKLLRAFVTANPEQAAVERLATRIRAHDYRWTPILRELFGSRMFFSPGARHSIIKSPLELVLGADRTLGRRANLQDTARRLASLGQDIFAPPTVKGWEGGRLWINSASMLQRVNFAAQLTGGERLAVIDEPAAHRLKTPEQIVDYFTDLLLARDVERDSRERLINYLKKAKGDRSLRMRGLVHLIMSMPEHQLV